SIQPLLSHSAARGASSLWANWRAMSRIMRWSSVSSISCISGLVECVKQVRDLLRFYFGKSGRVPARAFVLIHDERPDAFHDVAFGEPLTVKMQFQCEAVAKLQLAATAQ